METNAIKAAIARSISHSEIVTLPFDSCVLELLIEAADDHVIDYGRRAEAWGTDYDGNEWRIHMPMPMPGLPSDDDIRADKE